MYIVVTNDEQPQTVSAATEQKAYMVEEMTPSSGELVK